MFQRFTHNISLYLALYCAFQLTENFEENKDLLNTFEFVIVPLVNADGYEYSRRYVRLNVLNNRLNISSKLYFTSIYLF